MDLRYILPGFFSLWFHEDLPFVLSSAMSGCERNINRNMYKSPNFVWKSICSDFKRFNSVIMTLKALEVQRRWMNRGWWGFFFPLFIWLRQVLVSTCKLFNLPCGVQLFNCGMRDLVPWPGIEPMNPASGAQILCHWTTWGSPVMRNF